MLDENNCGITPAYAGKSLTILILYTDRWDHPPRMRGKVLAALMPENRVRITPAYAGKSFSRSMWSRASWDHPRVCGEKTKKIP